MVIATFSTGIDSQCFQVCSAGFINVYLLPCFSMRMLSDNSCSSVKRKPVLKMQYHMVIVSSISFLPPELCTLQCY